MKAAFKNKFKQLTRFLEMFFFTFTFVTNVAMAEVEEDGRIWLSIYTQGSLPIEICIGV